MAIGEKLYFHLFQFLTDETPTRKIFFFTKSMEGGIFFSFNIYKQIVLTFKHEKTKNY